MYPLFPSTIPVHHWFSILSHLPLSNCRIYSSKFDLSITSGSSLRHRDILNFPHIVTLLPHVIPFHHHHGVLLPTSNNPSLFQHPRPSPMYPLFPSTIPLHRWISLISRLSLSYCGIYSSKVDLSITSGSSLRHHFILKCTPVSTPLPHIDFQNILQCHPPG